MEEQETQSKRGDFNSSVSLVAIADEAKPLERKRRKKPNPDAIKRVMKRVAAGGSVLAACRAVGVPRTTFLKAVERDEKWRTEYALAISARAHYLVDEILEAADGRLSSAELTRAITEAVAGVPPERAEGVVRALVREQVQRDRLMVEARKWVASRLLPQVYGAQATVAPTNKETTVRVIFDPLPDHTKTTHGGEAPQEADYEVL